MYDPKRFLNRTKHRLLGRSTGGWLPAPPARSAMRAPASGHYQVNHFDTDSGALGADERGAVWPPLPSDAFPDQDTIRTDTYPIPHEEIRSALIFFDKFDVPRQSTMRHPSWCDDEFQRIGVLTPSRIEANGDMTSFIRDIPSTVLERRDRLDPGKWTLARPASALGFPAHLLRPSTAVAISLLNALPIFSREVELEDVLEFKHRAWSELLSLRHHLDGLAAEIGRNGVNGIEHSTPYLRFIEALNDHVKIMSESNREKVWDSFKASFDLPTLTTPGLEYLFSGTLNLATVGAGAAGIAIQTVSGLLKKSNGVNPFEYLTSANLEL